MSFVITDKMVHCHVLDPLAQCISTRISCVLFAIGLRTLNVEQAHPFLYCTKEAPNSDHNCTALECMHAVARFLDIPTTASHSCENIQHRKNARTAIASKNGCILARVELDGGGGGEGGGNGAPGGGG